MQITGKNLLSSAESLLKDKRENKPARSEAAPRSEEAGPFQPAAMHGRILQIQNSLSGIQNEYSREQARLAYLSDTNSTSPETLTFDGKPLFPESDLTGLKDKVQGRMETLGKSLRRLQVEMENLVALGFTPPKDSAVDPRPLLESGGLNHIDPIRVSKLTRS